jgi:hypothetical protein
MSSPVWQTKPSIKRPSSIAFATSPSTVAIKRLALGAGRARATALLIGKKRPMFR